ncbi:hypothetical protein HYX14_00515 [Candidatus Woesearchaeota archaeon]|nr:hypothetical protein [Candidatus Woesearchaeota archaeon]
MGLSGKGTADKRKSEVKGEQEVKTKEENIFVDEKTDEMEFYQIST